MFDDEGVEHNTSNVIFLVYVKRRKESEQKWTEMLCVILQLCFKYGNEIEHVWLL